MHYYGSEYIETTHYALRLFITVMTIMVVNVLTKSFYDDLNIFYRNGHYGNE